MNLLKEAGPKLSWVGQIAVPLPLSRTFSYVIPAGLENGAKPGVRVRIPFKNRHLIGYLVEPPFQGPAAKLKPIAEILDEQPVIPSTLLELTRWMSDYYGCGWGEAIENALPRWVKFGKSADRALKKEAENKLSIPARQIPLTLSRDQTEALKVIEEVLHQENPKPLLLYGITGSGKSEVYIRTIEKVLAAGKSAICLVPEIALTEQIRLFFEHHFSGQLEILHSKLNDTEKFLAWKRIERGDRRVILGPRSAVFAPAVKLGLIVMDEEHEGSYKQETSPRYHAREVAAWRARHEGALFLMGTATPSLEAMYRVEKGEMNRADLRTRVDHRPLPQVQIVDLRESARSFKKSVILSPVLTSEIEKNLKAGEGTMLLLNRRGFATTIHCPACGYREACPSCQVSLTFHQEDDRLLCHYCNFSKVISRVCAQCRQPIVQFSGFGTEKVESEVAQRFPQARIARLDADTLRKKGSHEVILRDFRTEKIQILIGTQMIAKGFDFPHVTLVGVILADVGLMLPDFRSSERTFQLLTQVAGRAGRGKKLGRVFIQTYSPSHESVLFASQHDYPRFYREELAVRASYRYPPVCRLINIIVRSRVENKAYLHARALRDHLKQALGVPGLLAANIEVLGPAPLAFYRLRGHYRWHVMVKHSSETALTQPLNEAMAAVKKPSLVSVAIDVDPLQIL